MTIDIAFLRTVLFLGIRVGGSFRPRATAFVVKYEQFGFPFSHLVTAEHVLHRVISKDHQLWARVNLKDGNVGEFKLDHAAFRYHPNNAMEASDVAVCPLTGTLLKEETNESVEMDFTNVPLYGPDNMTYTGGVGLGDEVWAVGLFRNHFGRERNIPIARIGNIAAKRGEPIFTKFGDIDAYLVETRSIGGLSGSPVFVSVRTDRIGIRAIRLLGLMHGHFDVQNLNEDVVTDDEAGMTTGIHTGIGIVVPVHKIIETIEHPDLTEMRKANAARIRLELARPPDNI